MSKEIRTKMSNAKKGNQYAKGFKHSSETRLKMSKAKLGNQYTLNKTWGKKVYKRYYHPSSKKYKEWRKSVFERDGYRCQDCGVIGVGLQAHHKKSWARFTKLRYKLDNGLTLCIPCHELTENYKGKAKSDFKPQS